ncbi:hypothetical protein BS50DRAFT_267591 [Corynespora cassiicola Philippines]|uniref:Uncharacterized protein n=1 Tax=Corynespora cassiicola Philippines TaxID=1448308 RepID=A0A2T2NZR9_CORCC|nr:hypothetical protein BS50DRAFT_267591 [Corynespora cassiicola Philippines]
MQLIVYNLFKKMVRPGLRIDEIVLTSSAPYSLTHPTLSLEQTATTLPVSPTSSLHICRTK